MEIKSGQIIKGVQLAVILGLSERHIRRLANENVKKKNGQGKYLFLESVHGYLEYMELKNGTDIDLKDEKIKEETKKIKKDIELKSLRISELKSQLHSAENVKKVMNNMLANIRGKLLALSNKLAPSVIACDNLGEIQDIIHTNILVALDELSNYDAETFKNNILLEEELEEEE